MMMFLGVVGFGGELAVEGLVVVVVVNEIGRWVMAVNGVVVVVAIEIGAGLDFGVMMRTSLAKVEMGAMV